MTTNANVSLSAMRRINLYENFKIKRFYIRGVLGIGEKETLSREVYKTFLKNRNKGRLSPEEIHSIALAQEEKVTQSAERYSKQFQLSEGTFSDQNQRLPMRHQGAKVLYDLLRDNHQNINVVANIGARVDYISSFFANKYEKINFYSLDFQNNISECNKYLPQSENWRMISGYPLDVLESSIIDPDVVFMSSTSVLFNNIELELYLNAFARTAKWIVLNEGWYPPLFNPNFLRVRRPEDINPDVPVCAGHGFSYQHNYPVKLARAGFQVVMSEIIESDRFFALQIVAVNDRKPEEQK